MAEAEEPAPVGSGARLLWHELRRLRVEPPMAGDQDIYDSKGRNVGFLTVTLYVDVAELEADQGFADMSTEASSPNFLGAAASAPAGAGASRCWTMRERLEWMKELARDPESLLPEDARERSEWVKALASVKTSLGDLPDSEEDARGNSADKKDECPRRSDDTGDRTMRGRTLLEMDDEDVKRRSKRGEFACLFCKQPFPTKNQLFRHLDANPGHRTYRSAERVGGSSSRCDSKRKSVARRSHRRARSRSHKRGDSRSRKHDSSRRKRDAKSRSHRRDSRRRRSLDHSVRRRDGPPFLCKGCGEAFPTKRHVAEHLVAHPTHCTSHCCVVCKQPFATRRLLNQHLDANPSHRRSPERAGAGVRSRLDRRRSSSRRSPRRDRSPRRTHERSRSRKHDSRRSRSREHPVRRYDAPPFFCMACGQDFPTKKAVADHLKEHPTHCTTKGRRNPAVCRFCKRAFNSLCERDKHEDKCTEEGGDGVESG